MKRTEGNLRLWHRRGIFLAVVLCLTSLAYAQFGDMKLVDGYYELETPAHLRLFSSAVNSGLQTLNARLVADIDMSGGLRERRIGTHIISPFCWVRYEY